ncbi:glycosyl transferase [Lactobacillus taiwanensis]|uniref:glycosyl transferase n=1 Tax=Lactobacillus taiwanensis TaxID=508451 RepID=UPI0020A6301D|nr:glycosyl transferase [Lactobacillus taiwanensis]
MSIIFAVPWAKLYKKSLFENSVSAQTNKTAVFPLEAVEERISMLSQLGFDITRELSSYRYRLQICIDTALKDGDYLKYRNAKQKMAILKKYKKI